MLASATGGSGNGKLSHRRTSFSSRDSPGYVRIRWDSSVQAVVLVVLFGFFVLGLLAYRTYMAQPPVPARVVDQSGERPLHRRGHQQGPAGLPPQRADGVRLGVRPRRLPRARLHRRLPAPLLRPRPATSYGGAASDAAVQQTIEDMRTNRYDSKTETLTFSAAEAAAFRQLVPYYSDFFSDPKTEHGLRPDAITDRDAAAAADGLLRLDGLGGGGEPAGPQLLVHEQLAAGAAGRQQADRERDRLVGALADRAARRDRPAVRRLRPLGPAASAGTAASRRRSPSARPGDVALTPAQRATAWFFFVMAALFLHPDARRRGLAALPRRDRQLLRLRPRAASSPTT